MYFFGAFYMSLFTMSPVPRDKIIVDGKKKEVK
jgi:hypothetical protein